MMEWAKLVTKEVAFVLSVLIGGICVLVIFGHVDLKDIGTFLTTVIGVLVLAQLKLTRDQATRIEQNSNGTLDSLRRDSAAKDAKMVEMAQEHAKVVAQLTAALPPGAPLPTALADPPPVIPEQTVPVE